MPEPITTGTIAILVAKTVASWGIKKGLDKTIDSFKDPDDLVSNLKDVVHKTIDEYSNNNKIPNEGKKFPFYESQDFLEEILKHQIYNQDEYKKIEIIIDSVMKNNSNIIKPKKEQIDLFLEIFDKHVRNNGKLMLNAIKDDTVEIKVDTKALRKDTKEIKEIVKEGRTMSFPKELTALVKIPKKDIIGRENDLENLRKSLIEKSDTALINGMGGIGKTTLAAVYISEFYNEYDHIVWLTIENTLEEAIVANTPLLKNLKLEEVDPKQQLVYCLNELSNITSEKPNLLVLDNAHQNLAEHYDKLPKKPNWHVLVTSRERITHFQIMELDFLKEPEAIKLFKKHNTNFSDDEVREIVNKVELHTLTIEILALSADKNRWSFKTIQTALPKDAKAGITIKYDPKQIGRIKSYLTSIFIISDLNEQETYLLKQFTALPNQWLDYKSLTLLLQSEKLSWSEDFAGTLENIYDKGFVLKDEKTDSYKMHPILVEALIPHLNTTSEDLKLLSISVSSLLHLDQAKDNPIDKFQFVPFGDAILKQLLDDTTFETSILQNHLASAFQILGKYEQALNLFELSLESYKINFGEKHTKVATIQINLANVYQDLANFEKARDLLEKALKLYIINLNDKHEYVEICRSNLATVYQNLGDYEKARDLLELALKSGIANFGEQHPNVARCQSNLATVYQDLCKYERARDLLELALKSVIANFSEKHPNVATIQSNLATVYQDLSDYERARDLLESALKSHLNIFGDQHPDVAIDQNNLAYVLFTLGEVEKARGLWLKAYDTLLNSLGEQHPHTQIVKKYLDSLEKR